LLQIRDTHVSHLRTYPSDGSWLATGEDSKLQASCRKQKSLVVMQPYLVCIWWQ
jgi:hypothetical protein